MKKIIIIIIFLVSNISFAQITLTNETQGEFNKIHNEKVYLHYNSNFLLTGESLKYKAYVLNSTTNSLSDLSKIAYIELVGKENQSVFKHKIKLTKGQGNGDYLLTSNIKSGNYKLIGYTLWMKNQKQETFFIENITIINPFENKLLSHINDSVKTITPIINNHKKLIYIDKKAFKKREKVSLNIDKIIKNKSLGNYSISVRKFDSIKKDNKTSSLDFLKSKTFFQKKINIGQQFFLPELRGNILYGSISSNQPEKNVSRVKIGLSITGENNYSRIIETNKNGQFIFNLNEIFDNSKAFIQIIDPIKSNYTLTLKDLSNNSYKNLDFKEIKTSLEIDKLIQKRSVFNQIENAYMVKKSDVFLKNKNSTPAFKDIAVEFKLDDYTRFSSMKEIFIEIIENSWVKEKKGNYTFYVMGNQQNTSYNLLPIVLIDGLIIQNHNDLFNINTKSLKSIWVYKDLYNFGAKLYQGIIALETFKNDYGKDLSYYKKHHKIVNLFQPGVNKKYFNQKYSDNSFNRIPDFRHQLYWEPNLELTEENTIVTFFTSDNIGTYEINIEGFSNSGEPISIKQYFKVE